MKRTFTLLSVIFVLCTTTRAQYSQGWAAIFDNVNTGNPGESTYDMVVDANDNTYLSINYSDATLVKYDISGTRLWTRTYNGLANSTDGYYAISLDGAGNIYAAGYTNNVVGGSDVLLAKYRSNGTLVWLKTWDDNSNLSDGARELYVSSSGNEIYITGSVAITASNYDFLTQKYDSTGTLIWTSTYGGSQNNTDYGSDIQADASGNVYVTGQVRQQSASSTDMATLKYNSTGVLQWAKVFNGTGSFNDYGVALDLDPSGNCYVILQNWQVYPTYGDFSLFKYDPAGTLVWRKDINGSSSSTTDDYAGDVRTDAAGNVYITGYINNIGSLDGITTCYNSAGTVIWSRQVAGRMPNMIAFDVFGDVLITGTTTGTWTDMFAIQYTSTGTYNWGVTFNGSTSNSDQGKCIATDNTAKVHVAGYTYNGNPTGQDATLLLYDYSGNLVWSDKYNFTNHLGRDIAADIYADAAGNVYVGGNTNNVFSGSQQEYIAIKYNSAGVKQWHVTNNGTGNGDDAIRAIRSDASGNVYVTGYQYESSGGNNYVTIKYNSAGAQQWKKSHFGTANNTDSANALTVDASGNVYVTGMATNTTTMGDWVTIKYDAAGTVLWTKIYGGTANNLDVAREVQVDGSGNVYVCGNLQNTGTSNDYGIVKYDASGNVLWAKTYNGTFGLNDYAMAMGVDGSGNVYITGYAYNTGGGMNDIVTVKYDAGGTQQWAKVYNGTFNGNDYGTSLTLDPSGNVIVSGYTATASGDDFVTIKYDPSGNVVFSKTYNGPGSGNDRTVSLKSDASGKVYTTGYALAQAQTMYYDYTTVVYDGTGVPQDTMFYTPGYYPVASYVDPGGSVYVTGFSNDNGYKDIHTITYCTGSSASAGSGATICQGGSTTLNASGGSTYSWSPSAGLSSTTIANPVASPTVTTTYTVTVSGNLGCSGTAAVTVTVTAGITVTANATSSTICSGSSTTLNTSGASTYSWLPGGMTGASIVVSPTSTTTYTVTGTAGSCSDTSMVTVVVNAVPNVTSSSSNTTICNGSSTTLNGNGGTTYSWAPGGMTGASVSVSPTVTTTYTVTGTTSGCSNTSTITITVNGIPNVTSSSGNTTICNGSSTTLNGNGGTTYSWTPGGMTGASVSVSPTLTTTYTVTGTTNGCSNTSTITITVNGIPNVTSSSGNTTICNGSSTTLNGNGGTTYSWAPGGMTGASVSVSPTATTTYTVTGTTSGCSNTSTITITVNGIPNVTSSGGGTICEGDVASLSAGGAGTYSWTPGGMTGSSVNVNPTTTTTYTVTGTTNGCSNTSAVTVNVNPKPAVPVITQNGTFLQSTAAVTYQWYLNGGILSGAINQTYTFTQNGNYTVEISDANGCTNVSAIFVVTTTGVNAVELSNEISVMPNPNKGIFSIALNNSGPLEAEVALFDMLGRNVMTIATGTLSAGYHKEINIELLGSGIYFLRVSSAEGTITKKIIKN